MTVFFLVMCNNLLVRRTVIALLGIKEPLTVGGSFFHTTQLSGDSFDTEWNDEATRPLRALTRARYSHKFRRPHATRPFEVHKRPFRFPAPSAELAPRVSTRRQVAHQAAFLL